MGDITEKDNDSNDNNDNSTITFKKNSRIICLFRMGDYNIKTNV